MEGGISKQAIAVLCGRIIIFSAIFADRN